MHLWEETQKAKRKAVFGKPVACERNPPNVLLPPRNSCDEITETLSYAGFYASIIKAVFVAFFYPDLLTQLHLLRDRLL